MPQVSDEVKFMGLILGIAIFILVALLVEVIVIYFYEHRQNDKLTFRSLAGTITDFFPETKSKEESAPSSPDVIAVQMAPETASHDESEKESLLPSPAREAASATIVAAMETGSNPASSINDATDSTLEQAREPIDGESWSARQIFGVALTVALMVSPLLIMMPFLSILLYFLTPLILPISAALSGIWTALAGAIGLRVAMLSWRQTVLAAVLAGVAFLVIAGSTLWATWRLDSIILLMLLGGMIWVSGGVFLLPLFDPAVRQMGTAPSVKKVARIARAPALLFLALVIILVLRALLQAAAHPASRVVPASEKFLWIFYISYLLELILVILPVSISLGVGFINTLTAPRGIANPVLKGSLIGGVGLLYFYFTLVGLLVVAAVATLFRV